MEVIFSKVLDMSVTASIVILIVAAARYCLKQAPKVISYALWAVVLFRLLCPMSLMGPVSVLEAAQPTVTITSQRTSSVSYLPKAEPGNAAQGETTLPHSTKPSATPQSSPALRTSLKAWASWIWALGCSLMALRSLIAFLQLSHRLTGAARYRGQAYLADHIPGPFVIGLLNPKIYIPSGTPEQERAYILAHEQHHIRRLDHIIKLLAYGALCLHWFNPLVWLAFLLAERDMEMSCDEAVLRRFGSQNRAAYAETLLRFGANPTAVTGIPLAFCEGDMKMRVKNIAKWKKPKAWVVALSLCLCAALFMACGVNPSQKEADSLLLQDAAKPGQSAADSATTDSDAALEKCRAALEGLQSMDGYIVEIQTCNYGQQIINDTSSSTYCRDGADWLKLTSLPEEGVSRGFLYVDGRSYNNLQTGWDENRNILWELAETNPDVTPWIASFQWDTQEVSFVSSVPAGNGVCITVQVAGPYYASKPETTQGPYQVEFFFDRRGELAQVEATVFLRQDGLGEYSIRETMQLLPDSPGLRIQEQYQRYLDTQ